jgi:hypothetical protein
MMYNRLTISLLAVMASFAATGCDATRDPLAPSALDNAAALDRIAPRPRTIETGAWTLDFGGPPFQFNLQGDHFSAIGTWAAQATGGLCFVQCRAGDKLNLDFTFENPHPVGIPFPPFARGTLNGAFVEFGGSLKFDAADDFRIPLPTPEQAFEPLTLTTPFTFSGTLKAWDGFSRDPLLLFDRPVRGRGTATAEFLAGPPGSNVLTFLVLRFEFAWWW